MFFLQYHGLLDIYSVDKEIKLYGDKFHILCIYLCRSIYMHNGKYILLFLTSRMNANIAWLNFSVNIKLIKKIEVHSLQLFFIDYYRLSTPHYELKKNKFKLDWQGWDVINVIFQSIYTLFRFQFHNLLIQVSI